MSTQARNCKPILVFLPNGAAHVIVKKLAEYSYQAIAVSTVPELFDALRSERYSLAIATRPDIDIVRNIQSIPVVNLEVFFHSEPATSGSIATSKRFNGTAFIDRIKILADPEADARRGAFQIGATSQRPTGVSRTARLWSVIKGRLSLPNTVSVGD